MSGNQERTPDADTVQDPEKYVSTRRLEDIFDARQELRQHRLGIKDIQHEYGPIRAATAYRAALSNYIMEIEPLLMRFEPGPELMYQKPFGAIEITPVEYREDGNAFITIEERGMSGRQVTVPDPPDPVRFPIQGLTALFELPDPISETFTVETPMSSWEDEVERTERAQIHIDTLDQMTRAANRFLGEVGFELEPDSGPDSWEIDV